MGKVAGRLVQSLVFSRRGPLAAYATPSPGLGFDYVNTSNAKRSPTAQGLSKSKMRINSGKEFDSLTLISSSGTFGL